MNRRTFLKTVGAAPALAVGCTSFARQAGNPGPFQRVRPHDLAWPTAGEWEKLNREVGGRLLPVHSPLASCQDPESAACRDLFRNLRNPFFIGDEPGLTQTSGWVDAWTSAPSVYAVAARESADVAASVRFAREHRLRLVVKGGGHSYQGTSCSPDSLLIWTRAMHDIVLHDAFVPQGCHEQPVGQPAVSVGAGAIWLQAYEAVTTKSGRYVQGGGCTTVGVAGLIQSGGFGSFSKRFGCAAAALLEAEVVTADGVVRIANACTHPDLFWALKGGGGGTFGLVTRVTLRTRELPAYFGGVFATIRAKSEDAFRRLIRETLRFYEARLFNPTWGEQMALTPDNALNISMVFQGIDRQEAAAIWRPFFDSLRAPDIVIEAEPVIVDVPARHFWNGELLRKNLPDAIVFDQRPDASGGNFLWRGDQGQVGQVLHGYKSAWLPASHLSPDQQPRLAEALFASSRFWRVSLHFNKGLAGAPEQERAAARDTAINPAMVDAFALAIIATGQAPAFPGIRGYEPDVAAARRHASQIGKACDELLRVAPRAGSYVSESDFFESSWQQSFWGPHYARLAAVKMKFDPEGLFFVHHGVGSEAWSPDGFTKVG